MFAMVQTLLFATFVYPMLNMEAACIKICNAALKKRCTLLTKPCTPHGSTPERSICCAFDLRTQTIQVILVFLFPAKNLVLGKSG
jgi:hypothetical protein